MHRHIYHGIVVSSIAVVVAFGVAVVVVVAIAFIVAGEITVVRGDTVRIPAERTLAVEHPVALGPGDTATTTRTRTIALPT